MRILAISDLHVDYPANLAWVYTISTVDFQDDILILAGDLTDSIEKTQEVFQALLERFKYVFYVPGNHDLWTIRSDAQDSIEKFWQLAEVADSMGIITKRTDIEDLTIVPLFSWYDYSFGSPTPALREQWADYYACRWPDGYEPLQITNFFLAQNDLQPSPKKIISFSHFLPSLEVMPAAIPEAFDYLHPVLGSDRLGSQVEALGSSIHIYGHSHVNRDVCIGDTRYVNNAFAYPRESKIARKKLFCVHPETPEMNCT